MLASYRGTPIVLVILAALILIYTTVMNQFVFGRHIYARGGNLHAAQLSGVDTKRVDFYLVAWKALDYGLIDRILGDEKAPSRDEAIAAEEAAPTPVEERRATEMTINGRSET